MADTLACFFCMISSLVMCVYASTPIAIIPIFIIGFIVAKISNYYLKTQR
jgi:hypothetical protein